MTPVDQIREKCLALQKALLEDNPIMPVLLREIHTQLSKDPEVVTLMSEEDIAIVVSGLKKKTQTELVTTSLKTKATTKSLKKLTVDDI